MQFPILQVSLQLFPMPMPWWDMEIFFTEQGMIWGKLELPK